ncbi:hypothetical protein [Pseudonocardia sp. TRM90224]|uniref:hypothetical protein n=1 Tax=Pseudonocardia sp. TRM90224 TaxID=2812678 RepID=UPI001E38BB72|nr:hypothetical protein [Pseudonocardia sp. TRM90224]
MTWLVWRRQRVAFLLVVAVVLVWVVVLTSGRQAYLAAPEPTDDFIALGMTRFGPFWGFGHSFLLITPLLLGLLTGAGLFSRDVEQQTHLFVLTHGVSRRRWWTSGVLIGCGVVLIAAAVLSAVASWAFAPLDVDAGESVLSPAKFGVSGIVPLAYTLFAFALAAAAGLLTRSALAAVVITVVGYAAVMIVLAGYLRVDYLPPMVVRGPIGGVEVVGGLQLNTSYVDGSGAEIGLEEAFRTLRGCYETHDSRTCLAQIGITEEQVTFQPDDRYWAFQAIESTILLLLSAAVLVVSAMRLRKDVPV